MEAENKKDKHKRNPSVPGEAIRTKRLLSVSDKLLTVIETAIDEYLLDGSVPDKSTLKQFSSLLKEVKDIQGIMSPLEKQKQKAEIAILQKKAEEDENSDSTLTVFIEGDVEEYAK